MYPTSCGIRHEDLQPFKELSGLLGARLADEGCMRMLWQNQQCCALSYLRRGYVPAFAMGFGTSSSAATMPVTMECGVNLKCRPSIVKFVIPLGTNINRDGAALYEAASVLFIAQVGRLGLCLYQIRV